MLLIVITFFFLSSIVLLENGQSPTTFLTSHNHTGPNLLLKTGQRQTAQTWETLNVTESWRPTPLLDISVDQYNRSPDHIGAKHLRWTPSQSSVRNHGALISERINRKGDISTSIFRYKPSDETLHITNTQTTGELPPSSTGSLPKHHRRNHTSKKT